MKKFGLILTAILFTISAIAQEGPERKEKGPAKMAKKRTKAMTKRLKLSESQVPQVEAINLEFIKKVNDIRNYTKRGSEQKGKIEALEIEKENKMKSILTPEQFEQFLEMKEKRKAKMQEHKEEHPRKKQE